MTIRTPKMMLVAVLSGGLALAGCASGPYNNGYGQRQDSYGYQGNQSSRCQDCGVVQDISQVYVQGNDHSTLGAVIGAVAGGVLGNQVGKGDGRKAATVAGAVAGGVVGNQVGKRSGSGDTPAWRISVRLDNGQYATVTQLQDPNVQVGDYVQIRGDHVYPR